MRRILIAAGLHGSEEALESLRRAVDSRKPEAILFAGGILSPERKYGIWNGSEWGMIRADVVFIEHVLKTLGEFDCFSAVIPGPYDTPLDEFLRISLGAELEFPRLHVVHGTLVTCHDVAVCGVGGRLVESPIPERDYIPRTTVEYFLRGLWTAPQPRKILLLPAPPPDRLGGKGGSCLSGHLIDSYHPDLCVVGGCTALRGSERVASTLVVNPGCLADGWAAWLDWGHGRGEEAVEMFRVDEALVSAGGFVSVSTPVSGWRKAPLAKWGR